MSDSLGKVVKELRERKGISQQDLAGKVGVSVQSSSNIEGDKQQPSKKNLNKIAAKLEIPSEVIEVLALDFTKIDNPNKRESLVKSHRAFKLLIRDVYDLV